jgi:hypothetical protein
MPAGRSHWTRHLVDGNPNPNVQPKKLDFAVELYGPDSFMIPTSWEKISNIFQSVESLYSEGAYLSRSARESRGSSLNDLRVTITDASFPALKSLVAASWRDGRFEQYRP